MTDPTTVDGPVPTAKVSVDAARSLLWDLVSTPSPSGEEGACVERLVAFFDAHGREAFVDATGNVRAPGDDALLLTGHVDTVPGQLPVRIDDGELWGRGAVDATGALAAMAAAAVRTGVSFAGVVGEEAGSPGARHLVADRERPDALVNGEPSGWDAVTLGYRGLEAVTYAVEVEGAHSAGPAENAAEVATAWLARIEDALAAIGGDTPFETVTLTPRTIEAGPNEADTGTQATVGCWIRVPPTVSQDPAVATGATDGTDSNAAVRASVEAATDAGTLDWGQSIPPHVASARTPLCGAFRAAIRDAGGDPTHLRKTGTADVNHYAAAWDCPMATYGPGDSSLDHAPDERLDLASFDRALAVLTTVAERTRAAGSASAGSASTGSTSAGSASAGSAAAGRDRTAESRSDTPAASDDGGGRDAG